MTARWLSVVSGLIGLGLTGSSWAQSAPDRSLQRRIAVAQPGDTLRVAAGTYAGPLVLDRPLTLIGIGLPRIQGDGRGSVVTISAEGVTLDGFEVAGSGLDLSNDDAGVFITGSGATVRRNHIVQSLHGIYVKGADRTRIERNRIEGTETTLVPTADALASGHTGARSTDGALCEVDLSNAHRGNGIHLWKSVENLVVGNQLRACRDGIYCSFVNRSRFADNTATGVRFGLHYMYSDDNVFEGNRFSNNEAGAAVMFSKGLTIRDNQFTDNTGLRGYGLLLQTVDDSDFGGNRMTGNTIGLFLDMDHNNRLTGNRVERNYIGVRLSGSSFDNVLWANTVQGNLHTVELDGNGSENEWSKDGIGNRWDREGNFDLNGDGVGELPHHEVDLFGGVRRQFPWVALLSASPGVQALQAALRRAPLPGAPHITDPKPLLTVDGAGSGRRTGGAATAMLAAIGGLAVAVGARRFRRAT